MKQYYNPYQKFTVNGETKMIPFIKILPKQTDKIYKYKQGRDRLDKISQTYYGNPHHGWLILLANPQFGGNEFEISDGEIIRIPFPFRDSIQQYIQQSERYIQLWGDSE